MLLQQLLLLLLLPPLLLMLMPTLLCGYLSQYQRCLQRRCCQREEKRTSRYVREE
jgi:hypothetical protein